jgi:antitoxin MazE
MKTRIQKWGNSLAVRIPKSFAAGLGFTENTPVEMTPDDDALVIRADREGVWDLDSLLAGVTDENLHPEWEAEAGEAGPEGREEP